MRFLSLFSGIEAASAAWAPLGWECAGVAEIDPFACAVLADRHPHVRNLGDINKITEMDVAALGAVDLVIFGSPCQDLSIAGKQKGLAGERSGLFFPAVDIITWSRLWCGTRFALWENVPGALGSNKGRDFAAVVDALAGLDGTAVPPKGWGTEGCAVGTEAMVEWSTLDAQWFGVAQRRRRVFALADFGDWTRRQPVLLEPKGMRGDTAPSREAGQNPAGSLTASAGRRGGVNDPERGQLVDTVATLDASFGRLQGASTENLSPALGATNPTAVAWALGSHAGAADGDQTNRSHSSGGPVGSNISEECAYSLRAGRTQNVATPMQVRRLTPTECERLQGFPDGYTAIPWRGKPADQCPDGPRYKTLGNSMAVPVIRWIGQRIELALVFAS